MPWLQVRVNTDRSNAEAIEDALLAAGAVSVTLQDNADQPILEPALGETPLWNETSISALFDAEIDTDIATFAAAQALGQPLPNCRWELLEDKDWEREWMDNYHPIHCGGDLWICPSWKAAPNPEATNLLLDPGLAFGTGTHPTTFMCLQWLAEQAPLNGETFVDYGCGSGILGIAAILLGGSHAIGTDLDPQALIATHDNAERNNIAKEHFPVYLPENCPAASVDITLANILAGPLAELAPALNQLTKPGGKLCLSGILNTQAETVMDAYRDWFDFDPVRQQEQWVCLTATKRA
jgi:ribosomal protein L11 methyltransferase